MASMAATGRVREPACNCTPIPRTRPTNISPIRRMSWQESGLHRSGIERRPVQGLDHPALERKHMHAAAGHAKGDRTGDLIGYQDMWREVAQGMCGVLGELHPNALRGPKGHVPGDDRVDAL